MNGKYKAVPVDKNQKPGNSNKYSRIERRFVIVDTETGEIVDDAQGYGYTTPQKAYAGWSYKNRDRSKDKEKAEKEQLIARWLKENKQFERALDKMAFEIWKGGWGPDAKMDAGTVRKMLQGSGYKDLPFTPKELLNYWDKGAVYSKKGKKF